MNTKGYRGSHRPALTPRQQVLLCATLRYYRRGLLTQQQAVDACKEIHMEVVK